MESPVKPTRLGVQFPGDNYTPYGYLDNPYDAGPWEGLHAGGVIRSLEACGFGWYQPGGAILNQAGLRVGMEKEGTRLISGKSFRDAGVSLSSRYHTSRAQSFDFNHEGTEVSLTFLLAGRDSLLCRAALHHLQAAPALIAQGIVQRNPRRNARAVYLPDADALILLVEPGPWYAITASLVSTAQQILDDDHPIQGLEYVIGEAYSPKAGTLTGELKIGLETSTDANVIVWIALGRGDTPETAIENARAGLVEGASRLAELEAEDERFWARAPRPIGDWPDSWLRGWVYDLETTRLMVRPPAGVLIEAWPTWQLFRPRVVLAENALDMMRLAYADPETAQSALLSAFRNAPRANVPCLFANGSLNMIAEGGDACGTSPAWCLPFHNVYQLYLWRPDRAWLGSLYPYLENYLQWWVENRRDADEWFVYRCTWEAGEDGSPRLDPARTGYGDIFYKVRPVELQAAMAHSAMLLTRLAQELGLERSRWAQWEVLYQEYTGRTRSMWDAANQRFRDLYPPEAPPVAERANYWDAPADHSALQLIPLLYGVAAPDQAAGLVTQLLTYNQRPWTFWASWVYTVVEAARAIGAYGAAGRIAHNVLSSVYPRLDRREDADTGARPGTSHEWWPEDLSQTSALNETYGWGATTATLLLRHVFGFGPHQDTSRVAFELAPSLQDDLTTPGRTLGFANLHFRGVVFDLALEAGSGDALTARLTTNSPRKVIVEDDEGRPVRVHMDGALTSFQIRNSQRYIVTIT